MILKPSYQDREATRQAICGDATGDDAYLELMQFDERAAEDYDTFRRACSQANLTWPTKTHYNRLLEKMDERIKAASEIRVRQMIIDCGLDPDNL